MILFTDTSLGRSCINAHVDRSEEYVIQMRQVLYHFSSRSLTADLKDFNGLEYFYGDFKLQSNCLSCIFWWSILPSVQLTHATITAIIIK